MKAYRAFVLCYPAALLLAFLATWLAARISLGHWPRPSLDDPKSIGGWVDVPYTIAGFLLVVGLPAFALAVLRLLHWAHCDETRRESCIRISAAAVALMGVTILLLRWDPLGVVAWYAD